MDWDLSLEPEVMEVLPYSDLLLDELSPVVRKLFKVEVFNR